MKQFWMQPIKHEDAEGMAYFDPSVKGDFSYLHDLAGQRGQRATMRRATKEIIASKFYFPPKPRMLPQRWRGMWVPVILQPQYGAGEATLIAGQRHGEYTVTGALHVDVVAVAAYLKVNVVVASQRQDGLRWILRHDASGEIEAHFNLYAPQNGRWTLMTQDHVIPRAKGGADNDGNLRTMCSPCNTKKGDKLLANLG
jgi:hypothetical protein